MKILVTGSSGFIGSYVVDELQSRGHTAIAFDRHIKSDYFYAEEIFQGDITDSNAVTEAVAHADAFIHLAGVLGTQETIKNPSPAVATNIQGGLNLFKAAAQYNVPGVNIAVGNHWMNNTYSITKSTMERFVHMFNKELGTNINIVRALNAYGPRQVSAAPYGPSKVKKIMPAFVNSAIRNEPIQIYGDGTQVMDMIYVADVAKVLVSALEYTIQNGVHSTVFEAGSGIPTTVNDIADVVHNVSGSKAEHEYVKMRPGEPQHSVVLGNPRTLEPLGIYPSQFIGLESGVADTVEFFRGQLS